MARAKLVLHAVTRSDVAAGVLVLPDPAAVKDAVCCSTLLRQRSLSNYVGSLGRSFSGSTLGGLVRFCEQRFVNTLLRGLVNNTRSLVDNTLLRAC